ncbi:solute carrier family 22 member 21 [Clonorchis sinensis]|uniref:Solute carrier family 22 member 21 n=1 Tax=Clonorchis sinensis TaxID=79923 RepID=H2KRD7_CLOSI|nr:solute carrier family 22 member 21 [Clonorchis sinensis]
MNRYMRVSLAYSERLTETRHLVCGTKHMNSAHPGILKGVQRTLGKTEMEVSSMLCISDQENEEKYSKAVGNLAQPDHTLNVDELLERDVGQFGLWQWLVALVAMFSNPAALPFPVFANSVPKHRCMLEPKLEATLRTYNLTFEQRALVVGPWSKELFSGCYRYDILWNQSTLSDRIKDIFSTIPANLSMELPTTPCNKGYEYYLEEKQYPGSVVKEFETVCTRRWLVPLGTSMYMIGMAFGFILGGLASDRFGRKRTILSLAAIEFFGAVATSTAPNYYVYTLARAFIGAANIGKLTAINILTIEWTVARYRMILSSLISLGVNLIFRSVLSLEAYYVRDWRWLNAVSMAPTLMAVVQFFFLVESPRWLLSQDRRKDALNVMLHARTINRSLHPGRVYPATCLDQLIASEKEECHKLQTSDTPSRNQVSARYCDPPKGFCVSCSTWDLAKNTVLGTVLFCGQSMSYMGLLLYGRQVQGNVYLVSFLNAMTTVPAICISSTFYRLLRHRRPPLMGIYAAASFLLLIGGVCTFLNVSETDLPLIVCANIVFTFLGATGSMLFVYIPELFPSSIRTQGFGVIAGMGRMGSFLSAFVNELDISIGHGVPLIIYGCAMPLMLLVILFIPDTTGENLPDFAVHPSSKKLENESIEASTAV